MTMKRACAALALLSILMLLPQATRAQGLDGGYGPWFGASPGAFPDQTTNCPYTALALYQQQGMNQQQQSAQPSQLVGNPLSGGSQLNSTTSALGSLSDSVALSGYKRGRKKRATSLASKATTPKNAGAGSAATATTRRKTPQEKESRSPSGDPVPSSIGEKRSHDLPGSE
jgi:hypothetical protein